MDVSSFNKVAEFIVKNKKSTISFLRKNNVAASSKDTLRTLGVKFYDFALKSEDNTKKANAFIAGNKSGADWITGIASLVSSSGSSGSAVDVAAQSNASTINALVTKENSNNLLIATGAILILAGLVVAAFIILKKK